MAMADQRRRALVDDDVRGTSTTTYSQAIASGDLVWVSGQLGIDDATGKVPDDLRGEVELVFENLRRVLGTVGWGLEDVMKVTVFVTDLDAVYDHLNAAFAHHFERPFPARSTVEVADLVKGAHVEIEAVARRQPV